MQKDFVLKAKTAAKRAIAMTTGSLMLGATVFSVAATDLGDYPGMFVTADGALNTLVGIGADANAADVVAAGEIISTLTQSAVREVAVSGGVVSTSDGKVKDLALGTDLNASGAFGNTITDNDVPSFADSEVSIDIGSSKNYDYHEEIRFDQGVTAPSVETAITNNNYKDDDWGSQTWLAVPRNSLAYKYVFDETIDAGNYLNDSTSALPVELTFLGKNLKITSAGATSVTAEVGTEYFLSVDDTVTVTVGDVDKIVTLKNVGSGSGSSASIVVDVDGVQETVSGTTAKKINGVKVQTQGTFYTDTLSDRSATILVGEETTKTYNSGDPYIGEPTVGYDWEWWLASLNTASPTIGVKYANTINDPTDGYISIENGESICFPNDYACLSLDSYTVTDYKTYTVTLDTGETLYNGTATSSGTTGQFGSTNAKVIRFHASGGDKEGFSITDSGSTARETDDIYLYVGTANATGKYIGAYYKDHDDNTVRYSGRYLGNMTAGIYDLFTITYGDTALGVDINWTTGVDPDHLNITIDGTGDLKMYFGAVDSQDAFTYFGHSDGDTTTTNDLIYTPAGGSAIDISGYKDDLRTDDGIVITDPDSQAPGDSVTLSVPDDETDFKVNVVVAGPVGTVTSGSTSTEVVSVASVPVIKLDTEITTPASHNLILVGGPAVNRLTAQVADLTYPTYGADSGVPTEMGLIKLYENAFGGTNTAIVVAGWEAANTREAANVLKDYATYATQLDGQTAVQVSGTSVTAVAETSSVDAANGAATE